MSRIQTTTNFRDSGGGDFGNILITKDYLISVYPIIASKIGIPPELWIWGSGSSGQLGDNTTTNKSTAVTTFAGGTNWKQVSSGTNHTAAVKTDGTLWIWGTNGSGQLGNNTTINSTTPVTTFPGGTNWKQVSSGNSFTTAIKTDGTLWTWGANTSGQIGDNTTIARLTPVTTFAGKTNWNQVSSGDSYIAAIDGNKTLWTWGNGTGGRLGNGTTINISFPSEFILGAAKWSYNIAGLSENLTTFSVGSTHVAAIKTDGTLWSWGSNSQGRHGNANSNYGSTLTPVTTFAGGTNWTKVSSAVSHTAAVKADGTLWTWGGNGQGRLGNASASGIISTPITTFAGGTNWNHVVSASGVTLAIKTDGTLWGWGYNDSGQLGNAERITNRSTPVTTFAGGTNWRQVAAAYYHAAAIKTDGTLWVWGSNNNNGSLGNGGGSGGGGTGWSTPITTFAGGTNWKQVSCAFSNMAAVKTDGTLWIWGTNTSQQLGNASASGIRSTPITTFAGGTNWKQVSIGYRYTIAIKTDGTLWTWGTNSSGNLGVNDTNSRSTPVTTFIGGQSWQEVSLGVFNTSTTMAVSGNNGVGEMYTWGSNNNGMLGINVGYGTRTTPILLQSGSIANWKQVYAGNSFTSAIKTDGTLWAWGNNSQAQLGNASTVNVSTPITTFAGGTNWKQVNAGANHTSALKSIDFLLF